jgi:hypothetical protein
MNAPQCYVIHALSVTLHVHCLLRYTCTVTLHVHCLLRYTCTVCYVTRALSVTLHVHCLLRYTCTVCYVIRALSVPLNIISGGIFNMGHALAQVVRRLPGVLGLFLGQFM